MAYIDTIDNRRVEIADVETGLVFGLSHFRHSMAQKFVVIKGVPELPKLDLPFDAFDLPAAHIYKVDAAVSSTRSRRWGSVRTICRRLAGNNEEANITCHIGIARAACAQ